MMKVICKKLISIALVLTLLVSAIPFVASAAETDTADVAAAVEEVAEVAAQAEDTAEVGAQVDAAATAGTQAVSDYTAPEGLTVVTNTSYPWTVKEPGVLQSGNSGVNSTTSFLTLTAQEDGYISFDIASSSESDTSWWDYVYYKVGVPEPTTSQIDVKYTEKKAYASVTWHSVREFVSAGSCIGIAFTKDSSSAECDDKGYVKNIAFESMDGVVQNTVRLVVKSGEGTFSATSGGEAATSFTGYAGVEIPIFATPGGAYGAPTVYSDEDCTQEVASGKQFKLSVGSTDSTYYVKFPVVWDSFSGYTAPDGIDVLYYTGTETISVRGNNKTQYPWSLIDEDGTKVLLSGGEAKNAYSRMKIVAKEKGLLSFDWFCTAEGGTYDYLCIQKNDEVPYYYSSSSQNNSFDHIGAKPTSSDTYKNVAGIELDEGEYVVIAYHSDGSGQYGIDRGKVKNISFDTHITQSSITFICSEGGFMSTQNNTNETYKVTEPISGTVSTSAGTFYAIPDVLNGYYFSGLYKTFDYQEGTQVDPTSASNDRTFSFNYPEENTTYYAKFSRLAEKTNYTMTYDQSKVQNVTVVLCNSAINKQYIDFDDISVPVTNNGTFEVYQGIKFTVNYELIDSDNDSDAGVAYNGTVFSASSGLRYYETGSTDENGGVFAISTLSKAYEPVDGFSGTDLSVSTRPQGVTINSKTNYPWTYADGVLSAGNHNISSSCSLLKITAEHEGLLTLEYRVSSESPSWDGLSYTTDKTDPTPSSSNKYGNDTPWTQLNLSVHEGDEIRFNYYKDGSVDDGEDIAQIRNLALVYGEKTITTTVNDASYGSVSTSGLTAGKADAGSNVTLTATPVEGKGAFVSWQVSYDNGSTWEKASASPAYTFMVTKDAVYKAMFAPALAEGETAIAKIVGTSAEFTSLNTAMQFAGSGDVVTLLANCTLTENLTIPTGVTLVLPYQDGSTTIGGEYANGNGRSNGNTSNLTPQGTNVTYTLTLNNASISIPSGARLCVGGIIGGCQNVGGATQGAHSEIIMDEASSINVSDGGILSVLGYTKGGTVNATNGAVIYEPFVLLDYQGGTITQNRYYDHVMLWNAFCLMNIQSTINMDSSSKLKGYCTLYFWSSQNAENTEVISDISLLRMANGSRMTIEYQPDVIQIDAISNGSTKVKVGRSTFHFYGDITFGAFDVNGYGTQGLHFTIPYTFRFVQETGTFHVANKVAILPGGSVEVKEGASAELTSSLMVYDGFNHPGQGSGAAYAKGDRLSAWNISERGTLIVDGTLDIKSGASFVGFVQTNGTGTVKVADSNVTLSATAQAGYSSGDYAYRTRYPLKAKLVDAYSGNVIDMQKGKTYKGVDSRSTSTTSYQYYNDGANNTATSLTTITYTTAENIVGSWGVDAALHFDINTENNYDWSNTATSDFADIATITGKNITLPEFTYDGGEHGEQYTFTGWNTKRDGSGTAYADGAQIRLSGDTTLYAQWEIEKHTVTWKFDDEVFHTSSIPYYTMLKYDGPLNFRDGYYFDGSSWNEEYVRVVEDLTYTAKEDGFSKIFVSHSLSADASVGVNFYLDLDKPLENGAIESLSDVYIRYSWGTDEENANRPFTAESSINLTRSRSLSTRASVSVAAKEMNDTITVDVVDSVTGEVLATETYKATDYLYHCIDSDVADLATEINDTEAKAADLQKLCKVISTYGYFAQLQFGYHTDEPCRTYASESTIYTPIGSADLAEYSSESAGYNSLYTDMSAYGMSFYGISMSLLSDTQFNIFYRYYGYVPATITAISGGNSYDVTRTVVGSNDDPESGDYVRFDINDIPAAKLMDDITLTFTPQNGGTSTSITVNPATYMYSALAFVENVGTDYDSTEYLAQLISALYSYRTIAAAFFA